MKRMTKLLLVLGAAVAVSSETVADPILSPRAQANKTRIVSGGGNQTKLAATHNALGVAAKAKASGGERSNSSGSSAADPDLVREQWTKIGSPRGLQQQRENGKEIQIAPLK